MSFLHSNFHPVCIYLGVLSLEEGSVELAEAVGEIQAHEMRVFQT
jgi:hypothetical protein